MQMNENTNNHMLKLMLIQHEIITKIMKYDKQFKPKTYNECIKKQIKVLLKIQKEEINDML